MAPRFHPSLQPRTIYIVTQNYLNGHYKVEELTKAAQLGCAVSAGASLNLCFGSSNARQQGVREENGLTPRYHHQPGCLYLSLHS